MSKIETISLEMIKNVIRQYENMIKEQNSPHSLNQSLLFWKEKEKDFYKKDQKVKSEKSN
jgi:hypothetical protein